MEYEYDDCTDMGIALLTAIVNDESGDRFLAAKLIGDYVEDGAEPGALFVGLAHVAEQLLTDLEHVTGTDKRQLLQDLAARIAASGTDQEEE